MSRSQPDRSNATYTENERGDFSYSDDYTKMTISAPEVVTGTAAPIIDNFAWAAELYQILNGAESWSPEVIVINSDIGKNIQQLNLLEGKLDWSFIEQLLLIKTYRIN